MKGSLNAGGFRVEGSGFRGVRVFRGFRVGVNSVHSVGWALPGVRERPFATASLPKPLYAYP